MHHSFVFIIYNKNVLLHRKDTVCLYQTVDKNYAFTKVNIMNAVEEIIDLFTYD